MDDPLNIWIARQIRLRWWDFYGGTINWYGTPMPTSAFMMNPPLLSYYLAAATKVLGWTEPALHAAMLLPTLAATWGTYELARRLCAHPFLATAVAVFSPVFIISSTTIMTDVPMLCLWLWATVCWIDGVRRQRQSFFAGAVMLILAAALTKYFAAALIPLLGIYSIVTWRRFNRELLWLLIPVAGLVGYQIYTRQIYSSGMLSGAMQYATSYRGSAGFSRPRILTGLSFVGGCLIAAVPLALIVVNGSIQHFRWRRLWLVAGIAPLMAGLLVYELPVIDRLAGVESIERSVLIQLVIFSIGGITILSLALNQIRKWRDPNLLLPALTVVGTFVFVVALNWTVSARTILPMAPAVGVLVAQGLERRISAGSRILGAAGVSLVAMLAAVSLVAANADQQFAITARTASDLIRQRTAGQARTVWFQGHWGFQYYMQQWGAKPLDAASTVCLPGDLMIVPNENTNLFPIPPAAVMLVDEIEIWQPSWVSTFDVKIRAGFYSDSSGPLPFAFGRGLPVRYDVYLIEHSIRYSPASAAKSGSH